jgi:hypothetical protein
LWKTIADLGRPLRSKSGTEYYDALVESAKAITSPDLRFAILIEVGNFSAINGYNVAFQAVRDCLSNMVCCISSPDLALVGLFNQMSSYLEKNEYIPDHMECWNNRGSLALLVNLAVNVKGGDKNIRKKTATLCQILLQKLEEF